MEVEFGNEELDRLETDKGFSAGLGPGIDKAYRKRIQFIRNSPDERDFYAMRSLNFEKLKAPRVGQYSMRLNDQYRLIMEFVGKGQAKRVRVLEITDYH